MRTRSFLTPFLTISFLLAASQAAGQQAAPARPEVGPDDTADQDQAAEGEEIVAEEDDEIVVEEDGEIVAEEDGEIVAEEDGELVAEDPSAEDQGEEMAPAPPPDSFEEGSAQFAPGEEPWRKPATGQGVIWGRILEDTGEPALQATVRVADKGLETKTDLDGYYRLELPPGVYTLEVEYPMFEPQTIRNARATWGGVNRLDTELEIQDEAIEEVLIEEDAAGASVEGLAKQRQNAVTAGDAVGREEISKTTDSDAAEAAQRVVGANIVGGRFVYVRGLGERYSNALLHGFPLPSPEPDRAAVPLDVFPTSVLESLTIVKTFSPDMPANFAGGSVQIETRAVPDEPLFQVSLSGSFNTQATFQDRLTYDGSSTDFLGFDDGTRALPDSVPDTWRARRTETKDNGEPATDEDLDPIGRDLNSPMTPRFSEGTPLNHGFGLVGGNTWKLPNGHKLGFLASANYSHSYEWYEDMTLRQFWPDGADERGWSPRLDYVVDSGEEEIRWGAFAKASYIAGDNHKITLMGLHSQLADKTTAFYQGSDANVPTGDFSALQLDWVERGLTFGMLQGEHKFAALHDAEFSWTGSVARAYRNQPDRRDTVYQFNKRFDGWVYVDGSESGRHFFSDQTEDGLGGKLDWLQPLTDGDWALKAKTGGLVNLKDRDFSARRFNLRREPTPPSVDRLVCEGESYQLDCPDELFVDSSIGDYLYLREGSQPGDIYQAHLNVFAGYLMLDLDIHETLRVVGGARVEVTDQAIEPLDFQGNVVPEDGAALDATDLLPAIALILSGTENTKTRLSYTQTLARPQLRELAPFAFADFFGGWIVAGNPDLVLTRIHNVDARFEYYPSLSEVLAFSVFLKEFTNPIERVLIPTGTTPVLTFRNTDAANVVGLELEARKNLAFLAEPMRPFSVITNFTLTRSRVNITEDASFLTNPSRELVNQSPWVYNLALDYQLDELKLSSRVTYNIKGTTLVNVGTNGLPDVYEQPRHSLDFSIQKTFWDHWNAEFQVTNIVNDDVVETQGPEEIEENITWQYTKGTSFGLSLGYAL